MSQEEVLAHAHASLERLRLALDAYAAVLDAKLGTLGESAPLSDGLAAAAPVRRVPDAPLPAHIPRPVIDLARTS